MTQTTKTNNEPHNDDDDIMILMITTHQLHGYNNDNIDKTSSRMHVLFTTRMTPYNLLYYPIITHQWVIMHYS